MRDYDTFDPLADPDVIQWNKNQAGATGKPNGEDDDPLAFLNKYKVSREEMDEIEDPEWIYQGLLITGQILVLVGPPGCGKTAVATYAAGKMRKLGYEVHYILADVDARGAKFYQGLADDHGWELLLPNFKAGQTMEHVVTDMEKLAAESVDLTGHVFIFDTLKKMASVMRKDGVSGMKDLFNMLRALTMKGASIWLNGHTNKYKDAEGNHIFEGVNDIKSDCDALIYLIPFQEDNGNIISSTRPSDKARGDFHEVSFRIHKQTRFVERLNEHIDTAALAKAREEYEEDREHVWDIRDALLEGGTMNQKDIIEACKQIPWKTTRKLLKRYSYGHYRQWEAWRGLKNAWFYRLLPAGKTGENRTEN